MYFSSRQEDCSLKVLSGALTDALSLYVGQHLKGTSPSLVKEETVL
jgi:hypothetical protein